MAELEQDLSLAYGSFTAEEIQEFVRFEWQHQHQELRINLTWLAGLGAVVGVIMGLFNPAWFLFIPAVFFARGLIVALVQLIGTRHYPRC